MHTTLNISHIGAGQLVFKVFVKSVVRGLISAVQGIKNSPYTIGPTKRKPLKEAYNDLFFLESRSFVTITGVIRQRFYFRSA